MQTTNFVQGRRPEVTYLSEDDKERIMTAALHVLQETGMRLLHPEARDMLVQAGCTLHGEDCITVPGPMVQEAIDSAPSNISLFNREGHKVMDLGDKRAYFGTGSDLMYTLNGASLERETTSLEHVGRAARLCDALPNIDFVMSFAHPQEISPHLAYLASFQAMAENTVKPIVCTAEGRQDLSAMWDIGVILRGSEQDMRDKPYCVQYAEPISPLKHPFPSVDKLLFCAEKGLPCIYSPAPMAGSTAPMTLAGHIVQGLAESLFGLVMHQLKGKHAPFIMGMGSAVLDMVSSECSYNAPEYYLAYMGMVEMSHYLDLPSWGYAGTSDSQIPDGQATFEAGMMSYLSALSGANLNHDVGYLDFGRAGSLEMIVICNEMIDEIRRMQQGIPVNEEQLAVQVIHEVGAGGHYLMHDHTLDNVRRTQWRPKLFSRLGREAWEAEGKTSLLDRARTRVQEILESHQAQAMPAEAAESLRKRVHSFEQELAIKA